MFVEVLPPIDLLQVDLQLFAALPFLLSLRRFLFLGFWMVPIFLPNNTGVMFSGILFPILNMFQHSSTVHVYSVVHYWVHRAVMVSFSIVWKYKIHINYDRRQFSPFSQFYPPSSHYSCFVQSYQLCHLSHPGAYRVSQN